MTAASCTATAELARLRERAAASDNDIERAALNAELFRAADREQRLQRELELLQRWVPREEEVARVKEDLAGARQGMSALDYAGAVTVLSAVQATLATMERTRNALAEALDAQSRFRQRRIAIDAALAQADLGSISADPAISGAETDGARTIERGDFAQAASLFAEAEDLLQAGAQQRIDRTVAELKATAELAIDRRGAPTARAAVDRAKRLLELRAEL
jgi:hypothetical protein